MFGIGKKTIVIAAPVEGSVIDITEVNDSVFSQKMLGDGFAVEPATSDITAPCDGKVVLLADTLHAVAVETGKVQLLIHVGIDTVTLQGHGFISHVKPGMTIRKGETLLSFDAAYLASQGKAATVVIIVTNLEDIHGCITKNLENKSAVLKISYK
jgi:sugar PTS system EIIA component